RLYASLRRAPCPTSSRANGDSRNDATPIAPHPDDRGGGDGRVCTDATVDRVRRRSATSHRDSGHWRFVYIDCCHPDHFAPVVVPLGKGSGRSGDRDRGSGARSPDRCGKDETSVNQTKVGRTKKSLSKRNLWTHPNSFPDRFGPGCFLRHAVTLQIV